jgi:hypothetical protein
MWGCLRVGMFPRARPAEHEVTFCIMSYYHHSDSGAVQCCKYRSSESRRPKAQIKFLPCESLEDDTAENGFSSHPLVQTASQVQQSQGQQWLYMEWLPSPRDEVQCWQFGSQMGVSSKQ